MSSSSTGTEIAIIAAGIFILSGIFWWLVIPRVIVVSDPYARTVAEFQRDISRWEHEQ